MTPDMLKVNFPAWSELIDQLDAEGFAPVAILRELVRRLEAGQEHRHAC